MMWDLVKSARIEMRHQNARKKCDGHHQPTAATLAPANSAV